jgi:ElaB/YqjD/DUF883 family membrane-anchored ribosome-binding protein
MPEETPDWFTLSEQRRKEFDEKYEKLHDRITLEYDKLRNELYSDIEREMKETKEDIRDLRKMCEVHQKELVGRIRTIERWKYIVIGIATAVGFFMAESGLLKQILPPYYM